MKRQPQPNWRLPKSVTIRVTFSFFRTFTDPRISGLKVHH
jgi:hypothetical protein